VEIPQIREEIGLHNGYSQSHPSIVGAPGVGALRRTSEKYKILRLVNLRSDKRKRELWLEKRTARASCATYPTVERRVFRWAIVPVSG
jgi:hypothetical protein